MRFIPMMLLLIATADAHADNAWEKMIEGNGTPFEQRWASAEPLTDESSSDTAFGYAGINTKDGDLKLYIEYPQPMIDTMLSALSGEELDCEYDNWRLAVDRREFTISDTSESTDNSAMFLQPQQVKAFWQAFVDGSVLAVQVERTCNGDMDVAAIVYSLAGSQAALEHVLNTAPATVQEDTEDNGIDAVQVSAESAYIFAIQQKIRRNWVQPPTAEQGLQCVVKVQQLPGGEVINVDFGTCNGDATIRRSIEAAVFKASPLPAPPDPSVFDRNLELNFNT